MKTPTPNAHKTPGIRLPRAASTEFSVRIVHCAKYFPPDRGGIETFVHDLSVAQVEAGHEVCVVAHAGACTQPGVVTLQAGLTVHRLGVWCTVGGYAPVAPAFGWRLRQIVHDFQPDVLHVHMPNGAALWALAAGPVPLVVHWHADVEFPAHRQPSAFVLAAWRALERTVLQRAKAVIVTSPPYLEASASLQPVRARCHVVPLGLPDPGASEPAPPAAQAADNAGGAAAHFLQTAPGLRVLAVGRLSHYKGFGLLCDAVAQVPGVTLCVVGTGEERAALTQRMAAPDLAGRTLLAGEVDEATLDACYRACHVVCLPSRSRSEAFGLVLLEAMARSRACLAAHVPGSGIGWVIEDGHTGLLVPPEEVGALATALHRWQSRAGGTELTSMGRAGRRRYEAMFRMPAVCRQVNAVYAALIA